MSRSLSWPSIALAIAAAAICLFFFIKAQTLRRYKHLPPGPPSSYWSGTPVPRQYPWRKLKEYTDALDSDIITIRAPGGKPTFVAGRASAAHAILEKSSGATADRPHMIMAGELMSGDKRMLFLPHGERWRVYRKIMHESLNTTAVVAYEPIQMKEATLTAKDVGQDPGNFLKHFVRYAASTIMTITYDHPVRNLDDPLVVAVTERLSMFGKWAGLGASMLDKYPFLMWIPTPLNKWKKIGKREHAKELELFVSTYRSVRERVQKNEAQTCFASRLQERQREFGFTDEDASYICGSFFGAGSDTTAAALGIMVMALITHPNVMRKAQAELDAVVGPDRLPTFEDRDRLPYIASICQEIGRWRPVTSGGFQHKLMEDVRYKDYVLPKGHAIIGNHWSISLDEREYPDPWTFKPERFLSDDGKTVNGTWFSPRGSVQFGFGRRVCVGLNVAERSVYINTAILLWAFNFRAPGGKIEEVDTFAFTNTANSHPLPFKAEITYRSDRHRKVVEEEALTYD